jgi:transcriptional regulator with XRE-family HTH domain
MNHAATIRSGSVALRRNPLTELLIEIREKTSKSQAEVARDSWLNESYVSRLFSGERTNPSRDALILLGAFGLDLPVPEVDELLLAADYKQLVLPQSLR